MRITPAEISRAGRSVGSYPEDADQGWSCHPGKLFQLGLQIADLLVELEVRQASDRRVYLAAAAGSSRRPGRKLLHLIAKAGGRQTIQCFPKSGRGCNHQGLHLIDGLGCVP